MLSFQFRFRAAHIRFERRITFDSVGVSVAVEAKITASAARFFTKPTSYYCLCHVAFVLFFWLIFVLVQTSHTVSLR